MHIIIFLSSLIIFSLVQEAVPLRYVTIRKKTLAQLPFHANLKCELWWTSWKYVCHFDRFDPYGKSGFATCRICKSSVHQSGSHYCQGCAYKKGETASAEMRFCFRHTSICSHHPLFLLCRNLCHVWEEGSWHQELQTDLSLIYYLFLEVFVFSWEGNVCEWLCWLFHVLRMII